MNSLQLSSNEKLSLNSSSQKARAVRFFLFKALSGLGNKRSGWKNVLHNVLREEFVRFERGGVEVNHLFILDAALHLVHDISVPVTQLGVEQDTGNSLADALSLCWMYAFCARFNIKVRKRTVNKSLIEEMTASTHKHLAYHLGCIKRKYDEGLNETTVEIFDETHIVIAMDNRRVLDFQGSKYVTYADVTSGLDCFTVCMKISGGPQGKFESRRYSSRTQVPTIQLREYQMTSKL